MQQQRFKSAISILAIAMSLLTCSVGNQAHSDSPSLHHTEDTFKKKAMSSMM